MSDYENRIVEVSRTELDALLAENRRLRELLGAPRHAPVYVSSGLHEPTGLCLCGKVWPCIDGYGTPDVLRER